VKIDNLIIIRGGAYNDIKKALRQWIELYAGDLNRDLVFKLYKNGRANHIIIADERLDNERFFYLVNYLKYPEGIEYEIDIEGYTTGRDNNEFEGQELLIYISPNDTEPDNVFVVTAGNKNFKIDFGGKVSVVDERKLFQQPNIQKPEDPEILRPDRRDIFSQKEDRSEANIEKRFKIFFLVVVLLFPVSYLIITDTRNFLQATNIMGYAVWGWLFFDYKLLQRNRHYFWLLALSALIIIYGFYLEKEFSYQRDAKFLKTGTTLPVFFLILQRPLRFAFKFIMKREPVVDKPVPSVADFIYTFILWMSTLLVPAILIK
jgi:hypothetical protein